MLLRTFPPLALVLLLCQPASALVDVQILRDVPDAPRTPGSVNEPAVITISGVMGGVAYQAATPPGASCSPSITSGATWVTYAVSCTLPLVFTCGDAVLLRAVAASTNGRVSASAECDGTAYAWCSTEPTLDLGYPWDHSQCGGNDPGPIDILEGQFDPIGTYAKVITCSATDAGIYGTRALGAYTVECVFPL